MNSATWLADVAAVTHVAEELAALLACGRRAPAADAHALASDDLAHALLIINGRALQGACAGGASADVSTPQAY